MRFKSSGILRGPMDSRGSEQPGDLSPESRTDVVGRWWILFVTGHRPVTLSMYVDVMSRHERCLSRCVLLASEGKGKKEKGFILTNEHWVRMPPAGGRGGLGSKRTAFFGPADERPAYLGGAARLLKQRDDRFLSTPSTSSPDPGFAAQADGCIVRQFLVCQFLIFARTRRCYRNFSALFH
ncbi:hypothetical protein CPAR01_15718 [Colletotrichum paranaense]|uniref:Uncharacterized protein n=1 Tax=Colletotrichum paranaense TaxID=1914294 RepID=A0ABQ9RZC7_9PEZI|nr:uncharacterized protein CPAR01_15718 [Colletotrichum paranaense]KAK1519280.1 hypothetical protein CPAR01_15718 [Colletotrichum paranaense]